MLRVLIICHYFPPDNKIGSIRPSRIAKYLGRQAKVNVTVLTAFPYGATCPTEEVTEDGVRVVRLRTGYLVDWLHRRKSGKCVPWTPGHVDEPEQMSGWKHLKGRVSALLIGQAFEFRLWLEKKELQRKGRQWLAGEMPVYDAVLSTFNTEFGHRMAGWYKQRHPSVRWVADFRDTTWMMYSSALEIRRGKRFARWTAEHCDEITVVGVGIAKLHSQEFRDKLCVVVPNGYDREDRVATETVRDGVFRFVYTGELDGGRRDMTPLFRALSVLSAKQVIDLSRVEVVYAGRSGAAFWCQATCCSGVRIRDVGFVSHYESMRLQYSATFLLLSSWCVPNDKDTLTGKYFEYLSAQRPLICIINGEEKGSLLAYLIRTHQLGVCYEAAAAQTDFLALCDYIECQYRRFMECGTVEYTPDEAYIQSFDYAVIAQQVLTILGSDVSAVSYE
jgi:hypothetical protein